MVAMEEFPPPIGKSILPSPCHCHSVLYYSFLRTMTFTSVGVIISPVGMRSTGYQTAILADTVALGGVDPSGAFPLRHDYSRERIMHLSTSGGKISKTPGYGHLDEYGGLLRPFSAGLSW